MASESTTSGPSLLLLFIHGFLGSEHTFHSFPADLKEYLSTTRKVNVHCRVLPRFDTKGDSAAAVTKLISQIKSAATEEAIPPYSRVMLLGHSMGGIMAVDAWSQLTKNTLSSTSDPLPYKIAGIACFDTPFFGLHHKVFSTAAGEHAVSIVKSLVPELPPAPPVPNPLPLLTNAGAKSIALATEMGSKSMYLASQVGSKSVSIFQEAGASALAVSSKSTLQALSASSSILNRLSTIKVNMMWEITENFV